MTLPSLLPLAGAAIAPVLERVIDGVTEGISFLDVLHKQERNSKSDAVQAAAASSLEQDLAELADRLQERFTQLGIDLATPIRLKQDGRERVVVDGDHPDRVLIESILGSDPELAHLFNSVAESATEQRNKPDSGVTKEFHLVLEQTEALIEFV